MVCSGGLLTLNTANRLQKPKMHKRVEQQQQQQQVEVSVYVVE